MCCSPWKEQGSNDWPALLLLTAVIMAEADVDLYSCAAEEDWRDKDGEPLLGNLFIMCWNCISQVTRATKRDLVWLRHEGRPHQLQLDNDETPRGDGVTKAITGRRQSKLH